MAALDWTAQLHQLGGLPLLPLIGKRPIHGGWPQLGFTPAEVAGFAARGACTGCGTRTGADANGLLVFDLDGMTAFEFAKARGCDPHADAAAITWAVYRLDALDRLKLCFTVPQELWPVLGHVHKLRKLGQGEGIEVYHGQGQIAVLGRHPDGEQYRWKNSPRQLQEIPPRWWRLALELLDSGDQPGQPRAPRGRGEWRRLRRCPICGRDQRPVCQVHRDGDTIRCFRGSTFSPPANLRRGEVIAGGWAYCGDQETFGSFAVFVRHRERESTVSRASGYRGHAGHSGYVGGPRR